MKYYIHWINHPTLSDKELIVCSRNNEISIGLLDEILFEVIGEHPTISAPVHSTTQLYARPMAIVEAAVALVTSAPLTTENDGTVSASILPDKWADFNKKFLELAALVKGVQ